MKSDKKLLGEQRKAFLRDLRAMQDEWHTGYWRDDQSDVAKRAYHQVSKLFAAARKAVRAVKP